MSRDGDDVSDYVELLGDRRRRWLLSFMAAGDAETFTREELVSALLGRQSAAGPESAPDRQAVAVDLHHVQLPTLEAAGVVRYDAERGTVRFLGFERMDLLEALGETGWED
jgi:hypothetical protein